MTTAPDNEPEVDQPDVEQPTLEQAVFEQAPDDDPEPGRDPLVELGRLTAHIAEVESLVRTVAWGVGHETAELKAALADLTARLAELESAEVDAEPTPESDPEPQAWVDYATAQDWRDLAGWVDWLVCTYDFLPSRTVLPCWLAHRGVVEELAALRTAWRMAAKTGQDKKPNEALIYWHDRWLHPCVIRLRESFQQKTCTDRHDHTRPGRPTNPDLLAAALVDAAQRMAATAGGNALVDTATGELL